MTTKTFLSYTAIIEALTGLALMAVPSIVTLLLFKMPLTNSLEIIVAMIAGAAIFSLALASWFSRLANTNTIMLKVLLFYNFSLTAIVLYAVIALCFQGIALWLVIAFHLFQTGMGTWIIKNNR